MSSSKDLINFNEAKDNLLFLKKPKASNMYPGPGFTTQLPASSALARARAFLPVIASANERLTEADPSQLDIEKLEDDEACIEMNIAVMPRGGGSITESEVESESDSSDIESNGQPAHQEPAMGPVTENNMKIHKNINPKPSIEVISTNTAQSEPVQ